MFVGDPSFSLPSLRASLGSLGLAPTHSLSLSRACSFANLQLSTLNFQLSIASPSSSRPNCRIMNTCTKLDRKSLEMNTYENDHPARMARPERGTRARELSVSADTYLPPCRGIQATQNEHLQKNARGEGHSVTFAIPIPRPATPSNTRFHRAPARGYPSQMHVRT